MKIYIIVSAVLWDELPEQRMPERCGGGQPRLGHGQDGADERTAGRRIWPPARLALGRRRRRPDLPATTADGDLAGQALAASRAGAVAG